MSGDLQSSQAIVHGRELREGFDISCDAVVVGSGAGGMTVATHLAEAGLKVVVLEEGPYYAPSAYQGFKPTESLRRLFREAGMVTAMGKGQTPLISLTMGRAVGGSSLLTGGVCFRIPSDVHHRWDKELGLNEFSEKRLESEYVDVERRMAVREVPEDMRSASTRVYVEGARKMGISMKPLRRNTGEDCEGNARCNFGCPAGAKRSVDHSYLPSAIRHGARVISDALVERVQVSGGRAVGVAGRLLAGKFGAPLHKFQIRARAVVSCCGTIHTPTLLQKLGLRSHAIGRFITLHPAARMVARFPTALNGWDGALQSVYSTDFHDQGFKLMGVYSAVNVLAASLPGVGPSLHQRVADMSRYGVFGTMVHDEGGGSVSTTPFGREPVLRYQMSPRDLQRLKKAISVLAEVAFEGGAEEVIPPIFGLDPIRTIKQARSLATESFDARRIECMAFHPLGSARMANDERRGVVDQNGECYELPGLFIADGSVLPTSIGVNSQVPVMTMATRIAWRMRERFAMGARRRLV